MILHINIKLRNHIANSGVLLIYFKIIIFKYKLFMIFYVHNYDTNNLNIVLIDLKTLIFHSNNI